MLLFNYSSDAAFTLDGLLGSSRESMGSDIDGFVQFATTENLDAVLGRNQTILTESLEGEIGDILGLSQRVEHIEIDADILDAVDVLETELGQTAIDRHLTTFETDLLVITGTSLGTLVTAGGGTAFTGTGATADALGTLDGTLCGLEII